MGCSPTSANEASASAVADCDGGGISLLVRGYRLTDNARVNGANTIEITVNGETCKIAQGACVTDLINQLELTPQRLAIELNLSILPRPKWSETELKPGDKLEIVHFVGGG